MLQVYSTFPEGVEEPTTEDRPPIGPKIDRKIGLRGPQFGNKL